jgi:hypothetical protein
MLAMQAFRMTYRGDDLVTNHIMLEFKARARFGRELSRLF